MAVFGNTVTNELDKIQGKSSKEIDRKRERVLNKYLGIKPKFRDPASMQKEVSSDG